MDFQSLKDDSVLMNLYLFHGPKMVKKMSRLKLHTKVSGVPKDVRGLNYYVGGNSKTVKGYLGHTTCRLC